ncbi:acetate--CoA ligase family protein [Nonomuraea harbinensis]|uniref:Acetate--CoA ligase family protein n=1 Tax=Nonomuraea harbinensis TaxID=1286938 RepID=A0ABW1C1M1_9ACTN|nr:acetate--CoA ligase family protein [Nonomuraea harbinensis]
MSLWPLFNPASVAVVGASATPGKAGDAMMRSLAGLPGRLHPVNPRGGHIAGLRAYPSVTGIPESVDLAVLVVPPAAVPAALEECGQAGVRAAVICAGGFAESGAAGIELQERVRAIARAHGIRVLGPNTSGFMNPSAGVAANFLPGVSELRPGPAAFVAQSGGVNLALSFLAAAEGLGLRLGVGLGNAVDVGFHHVLDHLADDEGCRVVGLHVEGVTEGRALCEAVDRLSARKPVVALKVGRADVGDFARSHTGALTGDYALTRAALAQAGAVVADDPTELVDAMRALAARRVRPRARPGIGLVTGQAGPGLIIADTLRGSGVSLPELADATTRRLGELLPPLTYQRNPVDTGRPAETFADVVAAVAADPGVAALVIHALDEPGALDPVAAVKAVPDTLPVLYASGGPAPILDTRGQELSALGVPLFRSPDRAARAARALITDATTRHRLSRTAEGSDGAALAADVRPRPSHSPVGGGGGGASGEAADAGDRAPDEYGAKAVLAAAGIRVPEGRACADREQAGRALLELGGPVVVKILDASVTHKSDHGGVRTGVRTQDDLGVALDALDGLAARLRIRPRYLVERQAPPGPELIVGGLRDPAFGPVVLLALGGVGVELAPDPILRLAPLSRADAEEMAGSLPAPLLAGYRGAPPVDVDAVADVLLAAAAILTSRTDIAELDINPLRLTPEGPVALDALIVGGRQSSRKDTDD